MRVQILIMLAICVIRSRRQECHGFPHVIVTPSYSVSGGYRFQGNCEFDLALGEDTWTVNITFDKDISNFEFWIADAVSVHPAGRWICVKNRYLQSTPSTANLEFHADFTATPEPVGNCYVLKNNQTACLSYDPDITTPAFSSTTSTLSTPRLTTSTTSQQETSTSTITTTTSRPTTITTSQQENSASATTTTTTTTRPTTTTTSRPTTITTSQQENSASATTTTTTTTRPTTTTTSRPTTSTTNLQETSASTTTTATATTSVHVSTTPSSASTSTSEAFVCNCTVSTYQNISTEDFLTMLSRLSVNVTTLSATRRKLTCAPDNRPVSVGIGVVGIVCICVPVGLLLLADLSKIFNYIRYKYKSKIQVKVN